MSERGIGFIVEDGDGNELEFHWTALVAGRLDQLEVGQRVQFDMQMNHRDDSRRRAVNIRLLGS
jgi:cold shock CspA family protein